MSRWKREKKGKFKPLSLSPRKHRCRTWSEAAASRFQFCPVASAQLVLAAAVMLRLPLPLHTQSHLLTFPHKKDEAILRTPLVLVPSPLPFHYVFSHTIRKRRDSSFPVNLAPRAMSPEKRDKFALVCR